MDAKHNVGVFIGRNEENRYGASIQDAGADIPWVVKLLRRLLYEDRIRLLSADHAFNISFQGLKCQHWTAEDLSESTHPDGFEWDNWEKNFLNEAWVVCAARTDGLAGREQYHAMCITQVQPGLQLACNNKNGDKQNVPGPVWSRICYIAKITWECPLFRLHEQTWHKVQRDMFV